VRALDVDGDDRRVVLGGEDRGTRAELADLAIA
jgi:hypothetical protein